MRYLHRCDLPRQNTYVEVSSIVQYWRCKVCGQRWRILHRGAFGREASRIGNNMSLRYFRWSRKMKRR